MKPTSPLHFLIRLIIDLYFKVDLDLSGSIKIGCNIELKIITSITILTSSMNYGISSKF